MISIILQRDVVALGNPLQERPVSRRTLRIQPEIGNGLLAKQHDFDIAPANVADGICIRAKMKRTGCMGHRLYHRRICAKNILQQILAVPRYAQAANIAKACNPDLVEKTEISEILFTTRVASRSKVVTTTFQDINLLKRFQRK